MSLENLPRDIFSTGDIKAKKLLEMGKRENVTVADLENPDDALKRKIMAILVNYLRRNNYVVGYFKRRGYRAPKQPRLFIQLVDDLFKEIFLLIKIRILTFF